MNLNDLPSRTASIEAEQAVLGALLLDNGALDRIPDLRVEHFYRADHRAIYAEACKQIMSGKSADVISLMDILASQVDNCLPYLNQLAQNTPSTAAIRRHADSVIDRALRRAMIALAGEMQETVATAQEDAYSLASGYAIKVDEIAQKRTTKEPVTLSESLGNYVEILTARMEGRVRPIATGFLSLDARFDGGIERGTLTVVAARPGMGKSAFGLAMCRNVSEWGAAAFLSMEMSKEQVNDRNIAAIGKLPISWLKNPVEEDAASWERLTYAFQKSSELSFYIDDQTALSVMEIRSKARYIKRKQGLDLLVIDQLSFITGGSKDKKQWELVGEYTRGLIALAKELNCAVVLLAQLNRDCESRNNKRPQLSDLAMSGSIEQDAANILFLYRDEIYNPDSQDRGVCEVICAKQRQGQPGVTPLTYIANQTRFENYAQPWQPPKMREAAKSKGFD